LNETPPAKRKFLLNMRILRHNAGGRETFYLAVQRAIFESGVEVRLG